jgi:hypothetical protein
LIRNESRSAAAAYDDRDFSCNDVRHALHYRRDSALLPIGLVVAILAIAFVYGKLQGPVDETPPPVEQAKTVPADDKG